MERAQLSTAHGQAKGMHSASPTECRRRKKPHVERELGSQETSRGQNERFVWLLYTCHVYLAPVVHALEPRSGLWKSGGAPTWRKNGGHSWKECVREGAGDALCAALGGAEASQGLTHRHHSAPRHPVRAHTCASLRVRNWQLATPKQENPAVNQSNMSPIWTCSSPNILESWFPGRFADEYDPKSKVVTHELRLTVPEDIGEFCSFEKLYSQKAIKHVRYMGDRAQNVDLIIVGIIMLRTLTNKRTPGLVTTEAEVSRSSSPSRPAPCTARCPTSSNHCAHGSCTHTLARR